MNIVLLLLILLIVVGITLVIKHSPRKFRENNDGSVALSTAGTTWFNGNLDDMVTLGAFTGNLYGNEGVASEYIIG